MTEMTDFEVDHEISHLDLSQAEGYYDEDEGCWIESNPAEAAEARRWIYRAGMAKGVEQWLRLQASGFPQHYLTGDPT